MHKWSFRTSTFNLMLPGLKFPKSTNTLRSNFWKNKMKFKILSPGNHENPFITWKIHNNPCSYKWWFRTSKFTPKVSGLKLFEVHEHTKIQFLEKIKLNSKIYPLGINKILLLYHLKQTSWQSMHKWKSFRTSNFTLMPIRAEFFPSPQTHQDPISGKSKMKF